MNTFIAGLRAEITKLFTTRMWWVLAIVLFAYIALLAGGLGALFGAITTGKITSSGETPHFGTLAPLVYSFATSVGYVFPVLLGALVTTGEFKHQTLTPTFLANPRRSQVLAAKGVASLGVGAVYGVVALVASVGAGAIALTIFGVDTTLGDSDTWALVGRAILAMALWAAIGVGLGVVIPSQVGAIITVLAFTQFVEPLLRLAASFSDATASIGKYLPGAASDGLVGSSFFTISSPGAGVLEWWQGGLVLLAYAVVLTIIGHFISWRRDVT
ncbi:ABC transporter permease [Microbacterium sp. STN6]|uniref:ABC transporter permease n=1 Tax=Microbacterium sp. STN6 TaxID=2995588 RepID=UPI002260C377|nr:ABC transporter permease [Microbacterium sp. STN6]MCX7522628.1 ABC transporter permease [Microbacterium sp. STN6]